MLNSCEYLYRSVPVTQGTVSLLYETLIRTVPASRRNILKATDMLIELNNLSMFE